jgi:O-antigen/teichoic acid export membrane protein
VFRDWVTGTLIRTTIPDRDALILLWAACAGVGTLRDMLQCGVLALGRLKPMATITGLSSVVSLLIMWFGIQRYGVPGAVLGILVGEALSLLGVIWLLWHSARRHRAGTAATGPAQDAG